MPLSTLETYRIYKQWLLSKYSEGVSLEQQVDIFVHRWATQHYPSGVLASK